ncbi:hypothetical protein PILCRDRAFT_825089 [Piloderma croceum F 1598]|uniref:Transcription factor domain-containing protein n=1 Tax=Piloderma croceum (strain F 1598) TaxID=765440 RepID=A0A0C3AV59_PILCF|nr:hypothetical protein PILCRDRAFT_825089 [Piloderma croceum F 1598]
MALPLGLNKCPPFHSISSGRIVDTLLPPPESAMEDEMRRNLFWLAYAIDRTSGTGTPWAFGIEDDDIGQFLPARGDLFDIGVLPTPTERQWSHTKDLLLVHPVDECDSFSLYIKGTFLITRVKNFNRRFRSRHYAENPSALQFGFTPASDARNTQAFKELDSILLSFRKSFPHHLKNFINGNVVDLHLYAASLFPLSCIILLHEPHADVRKSGCMSALRLLTAARDILDLIYALHSTSYDITLMDFSCTSAWYMSGRVLARFLQVALESDSQEQISTLSAELGFVQLSINKVAQRIPLAYSHAKILHDFTVETCGTSFGFSRA